MCKYLLILTLIIVPMGVLGQSRVKMDSLKRSLEKEANDTLRLQKLNDLAWEYFNFDLDSAQYYAEQSQKISKDIGYRRGECDGYQARAVIAYYRGDFQEAMGWYDKNLKLQKELVETNQDTSQTATLKYGLAVTYGNIGVLYLGQGYNDKALKVFLLGLKVGTELKQQKIMADAYNNIAIVYHNIKDPDKALEYYRKALAMHLKLNTHLQRIGAIYLNMGIVFKDEEQLDSSLFYYNESLKILETVEDMDGIATVCGNMAKAYYLSDDVKKAYELVFRSLEIRNKLGDKQGLAVDYLNLGNFYLNEKRVQEAEPQFKLAMAYADSCKALELQMNAHQALSRYYEETGSFQRSLDHYKEATNFKDSLFNEDKSKEIGKLEAQHEFESAEQERQRLEEAALAKKVSEERRRNNLQYSGILIFLVLLGVGLIGMGKLSISTRLAEGLIFFTFLLFFEFTLVLLDPYIERFSAGAPAMKLAFNALLAALIFPLHSFFESRMKKRIIR